MNRKAKSVLFLSALLAFANSAALAQPAPTQVVTAGPYSIELKHSVVETKSGLVVFAVSKGGKPAADLLPYATMDPAGTAVSTQTPTKAAAPLHVDPEMEISLPPLQPDTYTLRIHIRGRDATIYSAEFTIVAR